MKRAIGRLKTSHQVLDRTILNMLSTNLTQIAIVHGLITKSFLSYHLLIILDPSFQLLQFQLYEYYTC